MATLKGNYCDSSYLIYPYCAPHALDALGIECNLYGRLIEGLGIQCKHDSYPTTISRSKVSKSAGTLVSEPAGALLRILWQISSDGKKSNNIKTSPVASTDKSALNLKSDIIEQYWQSTGIDAWIQFDVGSGETVSIDTLALIETNISSSATIRLWGKGGANSPEPSSWGTTTSSSDYLATIEPPEDPLERNIIFIVEKLLKSYRWFRVTINDRTNPDKFIRIGRLVAGSAMRFATENCLDSVSFKRENYKDEFTINGFSTISNNRAFKKTMAITFKDLNRLQYPNYRELMKYTANCRDSLKALVIIDPTEPYQFSVFSKLKTMPEETHNYISADTSTVALTLTYDEAR